MLRLAAAVWFSLMVAQQGQTPRPLTAITDASFHRVKLPAAVATEILDELEYDAPDSASGATVDLNRDGRPDLIVRGAPSLCGNGGCPYIVVNGATGEIIGRVAGGPLYVLGTDVHGYAVIAGYSHMSAESATWTTYAFDRTKYKLESSKEFKGPALDSLTTSLRSARALR